MTATDAKRGVNSQLIGRITMNGTRLGGNKTKVLKRGNRRGESTTKIKQKE